MMPLCVDQICSVYSMAYGDSDGAFQLHGSNSEEREYCLSFPLLCHDYPQHAVQHPSIDTHCHGLPIVY